MNQQNPLLPSSYTYYIFLNIYYYIIVYIINIIKNIYQFFIKKKTNKTPPATIAIVLISNPTASVSSYVVFFTVPTGSLIISVNPPVTL